MNCIEWGRVKAKAKTANIDQTQYGQFDVLRAA